MPFNFASNDEPTGRTAFVRILRLRAWDFLLLAALGLAPPAVAVAQPSQEVNPENAVEAAIAGMRHKAVHPRRVAISPDGAEVAWSAIVAGKPVLDVTPVAGGGRDVPVAIPDQLGPGCSGNEPAWSPDGAGLAFVVTCAAHPLQPSIYLWNRGMGAVRPLSRLAGEVSNIAWSHEGSGILVLLIANGTRNTGYAEAVKPLVGDLGAQAPEVSRLYRIEAGSGQGRFLTPPDLHVFEFGAAAKASDVAILAAPPPGDADWSLAKLYMTTDDGGAPPRLLVDPPRLPGDLRDVQLAIPRLSPDGTQVAFLCGLMTDPVIYGGDVCVVHTRPGSAAPVDVTPGLDGSARYGQWLSDDRYSFVETRDSHTLLVGWDARRHRPLDGETLDLGETTVSGGGPYGPAGPLSGDISYAAGAQRVTAFAMEGAETSPEVYVATGRSVKPLTHLNAGAMPLTRTVSVEWTRDGRRVQGWLSFPTGYDPAKRYPLLVLAHGGPEWAVSATWGDGNPWNGANTFWPALGYFFFQPNPRGSYGQGEAFTRGNRRDIGYGDLRDILAGMDAVEAHYPIDREREGLLGWSYGGCMALFAPTQTRRFRASVAGAGVADYASFYGQTNFTSFTLPLFGATPYDDPAIYARSSAITFVKQARTPTLMLYGELDGGVPPAQGQEFWEGLRTTGVPSDLVVYAGQGHHFSKDDDEDVLRRSANWFARYMPVK